MTLTIVHVFADAAGFAAHVEGAGRRSDAASEFIEREAIEIYGQPDDATLEIVRTGLAAEIPVEVRAEVAAGFLRRP
jgi:hypothetical protein